MASPKELFVRIYVIFVCNVLAGIGLGITLIHLPVRIFNFIRSVATGTRIPEPKVEIHKHEPTETPKDTLLFIHGYPDGPKLFDGMVNHLTAQGYRCLVVALPGSQGESLSRTLAFEETADLVYDELIKIHREPMSIVGHDWGSVYTLLLLKKHPDLFKRVIFLDVGSFRKLDASSILTIVTYQFMLAMMYLLGHPGGTIVSQVFLWLFEYNARPLSEVRADMNYHYFALVKHFMKLGLAASSTLGMRQCPEKPHLFIYGQKKELFFHDDDWIKHIENTPCGKVEAMTNAGHWLMLEDEQECNKLVTEWLERTKSLATRTE